MIASLRGIVQHVGASLAVIEVGGVGYEVHVTPEHARRLRVGQETLVHTAHLVREDDVALYGFEDRDRLEVFDLLRSVSGVGPKSALGVLAELPPDGVAQAIASQDDAAFRKVSGIGPKTAKLIVVALAGKLPAFHAHGAPAVGVDVQRTQRLAAALEGLGFPERRVGELVDEVAASHPDADDTALVRHALAALGQGARR